MGIPHLGKRFRRGLVFKAHRPVYHSTLGLRVIKKKKKDLGNALVAAPLGADFAVEYGTYTNMAHIRQSRSDSGRGFQVKVLKTF